MKEFLRKRWFLVSLFVLITSGLTIGAHSDPDAVRSVTKIVPPGWVTAAVLFLMAFSLDSKKLGNSLRAPGPVAWASLVNFGAIPLIAWGCSQFQRTPDFQFGLMIAACAPCTMAAASVWTRRAGGNDAVALLVTILTNGLCFVVTPLLLNATTPGNVNLDFMQMFWRLVYAVLIPVVVGQLFRQLPGPERFAVKHKTLIGVVAQSCILIIVFSAACNAGIRLTASDTRPDLTAIVVVWVTCIGVHLLAMLISFRGSGLIGFSREDRIATAFCGSQKTLPIGVLIATDAAMFGNPDLLGPGIGIPFAVFPMLMYHASQLFIDTVVADRFKSAQRAEPTKATADNT